MVVCIILDEYQFIGDITHAVPNFSEAFLTQLEVVETLPEEGLFGVNIMVKLMNYVGEKVDVLCKAFVNDGYLQMLQSEDPKLRAEALDLLFWETIVCDKTSAMKDSHPGRYHQRTASHFALKM